MNQEQIGKFITTLRKEKGLTQEQLAEKLNVNNKTVSRWETGKNMPDYSILESLTSELGITVNELIRGERIIKEEIVREYDHNLVDVLKEYKRLKKAKNTILILLLILVWVVGVVMWFAFGVGLSVMTMTTAEIEINDNIALYQEFIGPDARREYRGKHNNMDESIFPEQITGDMNVADYKMVYYNPWDPQWLSYLVIDYDDSAWEEELNRLNDYPSTEYKGYYGVTGFGQYELLAVYADEYYGFVYALADRINQRIIYVEIIFCNYFMDIDYEEYIANEYLPDGFDATYDNSYRKELLNRP